MNTYTFTPADSNSLSLFHGVLFLTMYLIFFATRNLDKTLWQKVMFFLFSWCLVWIFLPMSGLLETHTIPLVPILFAANIIWALILAFSTWGTKWATLPLWQLVFFQCFRLPLEIVLHLWANQGTIPETMTWTGQNFDIATGILAVIGFAKPFRTRTYALIFNVAGFALLLNVLRVVVMSSPLPFAWPLENPLQLAFHVPYSLIVPVCVFPALVGHLVLTRALLKK